MVGALLNILVIFSLIFLGYWLSYKKWFDDRIADMFSKLVLTIALPLNIFYTILKNFSPELFKEIIPGMVLPCVSILITFLISSVYSRVTNIPAGRKGTFSTMFTCSNTVFIGLPINLAIFGEKSIPFALLYYIVTTTFFWTIGIFIIAKDNPFGEKASLSFHPKVALKKILTPALMGFLIGIIWMLIELPQPDFFISFVVYLGNLTTPLSMFIIGIIVYQTGIKNLKIDKDIIGIIVGRYIISPLVVYLLARLILIPDLMLKVFLVQSSMPIQNSVPILARKYKADVEFTTSSLGYTVLIYLIYIPIFLFIIL